jgi:hypothetical protein
MLEKSADLTAHISHRLLPESGVIVVEIKGALRASDFASLAATADAWIGTHGTLNGLVLHAHHFPGWESLRSVISHVRFVRDHHREVKRIALVTDSRLASLTSQIAEHFVAAKIEVFGYEKLEAATAWAGGAATSSA